jgi:hypothetical protein
MTQTPIPSSQYAPISKYGGYSYGYGSQNYRTGYQRQPRNTYEDFSPVHESQGDYFNNGNGNGNENWYGNADQGGQLLKNAKRTIQITNLPESTTHNDITNIIRGGMLLDIFLRSNDRTVAVSFVDEHEANGFFRHAKRNDLYIKGKRVQNLRIHQKDYANMDRLTFNGLIAISLFPIMWPTRSEWELPETS